jgi:superfamily II RNA helicase
MTDIFEGSIIRVARRLDELMQQLARAAQVGSAVDLVLWLFCTAVTVF